MQNRGRAQFKPCHPEHWPSEATLDLLQQKYPAEFAWLTRNLGGRRVAGRILFGVSRAQPKIDGKEYR